MRSVNAGAGEIAITLTTGGQIVSGYLISGKSFLIAFGDDFASVSGRDWVKAMFADLADRAYGDGRPPDAAVHYLHLRDARFFGFGEGGRVIPTEGGAWWRGRISAIDGFSIGRLSMDPDQRPATVTSAENEDLSR